MPEEGESKTFRTVEARRFVPKPFYGNRAELQNLFDTVPIKEVREELLSQLGPPTYEEGMNWFEERLRDFMSINDSETVMMLLRSMCFASSSFRPRTFTCILDVFEWVFDDRPAVDSAGKEIVVIFCGHIKRNPESYDDRARECVRRALDVSGYASVSEEQMRIIARLLRIISMVRDAKLLPEVRKLVMPLTAPNHSLRGLDHKFEYLSVCEEEIAVDAYARQCVAFLEGLCGP